MAAIVEAEDPKFGAVNEAPPVSLSPAVATVILRQHRAMVREIRAAALQNTASNGHGFGDFLPDVISRLDRYEHRLSLAEKTDTWAHVQQDYSPATQTGTPQPAPNACTVCTRPIPHRSTLD